MAAGVIAFGAGWLISSLLPASEKKKKKKAAAQVKDKTSGHSDTLVAPMKHAAAERDAKDQMASSSSSDSGSNLSSPVSSTSSGSSF